MIWGGWGRRSKIGTLPMAGQDKPKVGKMAPQKRLGYGDKKAVGLAHAALADTNQAGGFLLVKDNQSGLSYPTGTSCTRERASGVLGKVIVSTPSTCTALIWVVATLPFRSSIRSNDLTGYSWRLKLGR
jgi:hypothetical protein